MPIFSEQDSYWLMDVCFPSQLEIHKHTIIMYGIVINMHSLAVAPDFWTCLSGFKRLSSFMLLFTLPFRQTTVFLTALFPCRCTAFSFSVWWMQVYCRHKRWFVSYVLSKCGSSTIELMTLIPFQYSFHVESNFVIAWQSFLSDFLVQSVWTLSRENLKKFAVND